MGGGGAGYDLSVRNRTSGPHRIGAQVADRPAEDALMDKLVGEGSRTGSTAFGRLADVAKQPPLWAGVAGALALCGPRGRHAALRGGVSYVAASLLHLPIKALIGRSRPPGAERTARVGPITSSFPSGHAASELAFSIAAAQEVPLLFVPLYAATAASEWSLLRSRSHYVSDVFAGGALGVGVAMAAWKLWPPPRAVTARRATAANGHQRQGSAEGPPQPAGTVDPAVPAEELGQLLP